MRNAGAIVLGGILPLLTLPARQASAQELSPQEIFRRVAPSVVVVEVKDVNRTGKFRLIASGSGVVVPDRSKDEILVATNCHVVDQSPSGAVRIRQGDDVGLGDVEARDAEHDLCLVRGLMIGNPDSNGKGEFKELTAAQVGSSQWLEVGDPVYAVGAPQGLELSLSDGLVSAFREYRGSEYIQTTAPISKGSSGGGLFDAQGRLVGITTMYVQDGQALNFAVPAELIASVPKIKHDEKPQRHVTAAQEAADSAAAAAAATADAAQAAADAAAEVADPMPSGRRGYRRTEDRWWTFYEDGELEIAFDLETASKTGASVTVWERTRFAKPRHSSSGKAYVEDVSRSTYHCGSRKHSFDQFTWRDADGEVVQSRTLKSWEIERQDVMPETIGEAKYEAACNP